jgi:hypothetical protein
MKKLVRYVLFTSVCFTYWPDWFTRYWRKIPSSEEQGTSISREQEVSLLNSQHKSCLTDVPFETGGNLEFVFFIQGRSCLMEQQS